MSEEIARRKFIGGAIAISLSTAALLPQGCGSRAGAEPVAEITQSPRLAGRLRLALPEGVKIRGLNHVLRISEPDDGNGWAAMWKVWDWSGWIQPQLDDIATVGNAVRFWGNTLVLAEGQLTLAQYLDQWKQALDYSQDRGLLIYPCAGDLAHWGDYSLDDSVSCYDELAGLLAEYPNVIGVDVVNEAALYEHYLQRPSPRLYQQSVPYDEFVKILSDVIRRHNLPIAFSRSISSPEQWIAASPLDGVGDFLDFHVYYPAAPNDSLSIYTQSWATGKQMLIGEFGMALNESLAKRRDYFQQILALSETDPNCRGAFGWSAYDPATEAERETGLFDRRREFRKDIGEKFLEFPTAFSR